YGSPRAAGRREQAGRHWRWSRDLLRLAAGAGAQRRHHRGVVVGDEAYGAVGKQEVAAGDVQAPEVELVARVVDVPRAETVRPARAGVQLWVADRFDVQLGGPQGHVAGAGVADRAEVEVPLAGAGVPPAEIQVVAGRPFAGCQRVAGAVGDVGE